jgi:hypothetical protein
VSSCHPGQQIGAYAGFPEAAHRAPIIRSVDIGVTPQSQGYVREQRQVPVQVRRASNEVNAATI